MSRDVLTIELDALARLAPELRSLAATLRQLRTLPETPADTPTLATARSVTAETLPGIRSRVADRFTTLGDRVDGARTEFANAEADRATVITGSGSQIAPPSPVVQV
jgi:hypothetical protein